MIWRASWGAERKFAAIVTARTLYCGLHGRRKQSGEPPHAWDCSCAGRDDDQRGSAGGMERQALGDAINCYNAEGLEGLFDRAKPGRPRKLDAAQEKELSELLIQGPDPDKDGISAYARRQLRWRREQQSAPALSGWQEPQPLRSVECDGASGVSRPLPDAAGPPWLGWAPPSAFAAALKPLLEEVVRLHQGAVRGAEGGACLSVALHPSGGDLEYEAHRS